MRPNLFRIIAMDVWLRRSTDQRSDVAVVGLQQAERHCAHFLFSNGFQHKPPPAHSNRTAQSANRTPRRVERRHCGADTSEPVVGFAGRLSAPAHNSPAFSDQAAKGAALERAGGDHAIMDNHSALATTLRRAMKHPAPH